MLNTRSNFTGAVFDDIEQDKLPSEDDQVQYYVSNGAWHLPLCGSDKAPWWPLWDALPLFDKDRVQSEVVAVVNLSTRPRPVQLVMDQVRKNSSCSDATTIQWSWQSVLAFQILLLLQTYFYQSKSPNPLILTGKASF